MSLTRRAPLALLAVLFAGCDDPTTPLPSSDEGVPTSWAVSLDLVPSAPAVCSAPTDVGLMLGPDIRSGSVQVTNDESNFYVTLRSETGRSILASALFVGDAPSEIPTTRRGLPRLLQFPYRSGHARGTAEVVWEVPLSDVTGDEAVFAVFAQVGFLPSWGEGEPITPGRHWAMYFTHPIAECAAETVDQAGGTVTTPGARASLVVAPGALTQPVDITIEPATVDDLLDHISEMDGGDPLTSDSPSGAPAAVDPELPTVFGITPIAGTIWDLGPDGLEFLTPATLVLHYDEADLPPGVSEEDLGVFIINGIFERLGGTVDADANTITAEIGHFTYAFVGPAFGESVDLEVATLDYAGAPAAVEVNAAVDVTSEVRNNGPGMASGGTIVYEAFGDLVLGDVADSCYEVTDPTPADVAVSCDLPSLALDETVSLPALQIIPHVGGTMSVTATVSHATHDQDQNPENDQKDLDIEVDGAIGAVVDLKLGLQMSAGSEPIVGGLVGFLARVDNLGPGASSGGTLQFSAFGDVVLGDVPGNCIANDTGPEAVGMLCDVDPLAPFELDLSGPFRIIAQSPGDVLVKALVIPADGDIDVNPENDQLSWTLSIGSNVQVDLEPFEERIIPGVGDLMVFQAKVFNWGPHPSNGGTMVYEIDGNVGLTDLAESCTDATNPGFTIRVLCPFGAINSFSLDPIGWVEIDPLSDGIVTFSATAIPIEGDVDVNPENNRQELERWVGIPLEVDLDLVSFDLGPGVEAVVGTPMDFISSIRNLGPDASRGGTVTFSATGDVVLGDVLPFCTGETNPGGVVVSCEVAALSVGATDGNGRLQIIPQSEGDVTLQAFVTTAVGNSDPNRANDFVFLTVSVGPGE